MSWADSTPTPQAPAPKPTSYPSAPSQSQPQPQTVVWGQTWVGALISAGIDFFKELPQTVKFALVVIASLVWAGYVVIPSHIEKIATSYEAVIQKAEAGHASARADFIAESKAERAEFRTHLETIEKKADERQQKTIEAWDKHLGDLLRAMGKDRVQQENQFGS
jgi:hypothetical protein